MEQTSAIVGLLAQTSIHAGTGQQTGVIDLPIQREGHNGWPCVFGSAVKGALRADAEQQVLAKLKQTEPLAKLDDQWKKVQADNAVSVVFGPSPDETGGKHAGALIVTDARLLLFPVRSLTSQFKWVTCPAALRRYQTDCERLGVARNDCDWGSLEVNDTDGVSSALIPEDSAENYLFLEEYRFKTDSMKSDKLIKCLAQLMPSPGHAEKQLAKQLVIVSDDSFAHIVSHATPVNAHISIESQTKIVRDGGLWYEETLPPETLLYIGLSAQAARKERPEMTASEVLNSVLGNFKEKSWLQLGGNETVGMGWCAVKPLLQED